MLYPTSYRLFIAHPPAEAGRFDTDAVGAEQRRRKQVRSPRLEEGQLLDLITRVVLATGLLHDIVFLL